MATLLDPTRLAKLCVVLAQMVTGWWSVGPTVGGWADTDMEKMLLSIFVTHLPL